MLASIMILTGAILALVVLSQFQISVRLAEKTIPEDLPFTRTLFSLVFLVYLSLIAFVVFNEISDYLAVVQPSNGADFKYTASGFLFGIALYFVIPNMERRIRARRSNFRLAKVDKAYGRYKGISVSLDNVPCLVNRQGQKRKYPYANFGHDLITTLIDENISDFSVVRKRLEMKSAMEYIVKLKGYDEIMIRISADGAQSEDKFYFELAEAISEAFKSITLSR